MISLLIDRIRYLFCDDTKLKYLCCFIFFFFERKKERRKKKLKEIFQYLIVWPFVKRRFTHLAFLPFLDLNGNDIDSILCLKSVFV